MFIYIKQQYFGENTTCGITLNRLFVFFVNKFEIDSLLVQYPNLVIIGHSIYAIGQSALIINYVVIDLKFPL